MERIFITGITGFIGSRLARRFLDAGAEVYGLVREPVNDRYLQGLNNRLNLLVYDGSYESVEIALAASGPDLIYHLAAYYSGSHHPKEIPIFIQSNITLGTYLLDAMASGGYRRLIYAETVMEHYQGESYCPLNLYAATKHAFSDILAYYTDAGFLQATALVLSDTYGPGDERPKILNLIKRAVQTGETLALSKGDQDYDVVYIDDVVRAFELAGKRLLEHDRSCERFQISPREVFTLRETVEQFLQVNQLTLKARWGRRPPSDREIRNAVRLYPPLPGWTPEISLPEGLRRFWQAG